MNLALGRFNEFKPYALVFVIYLIISLAMFWNLTSNITTRVVNGGGDVYQSMWSLWWVPFSVFTLHQSPYITHFLFYPIGANLVAQTMTPLAGILSLPFQLVSVAFAYNLLFFTSFALGGLFMFLLAEYIVKNRYAAFVAGLIFAFSPMHIAQSYSHLQWTLIEFIPLFVLYFLIMLKSKNRKHAVYAAVSFLLLTFMGDIQQGIIMVTFAVISLALLAIIERGEAFKKDALLSLGVFVAAVLVMGSPFFASIIPNLGSALSSANQLSDVAHNMLYSDNLASFFLPSYYNGIFHGASLGYLNSTYGLTLNATRYAPNITEKVSYLGYSVILLMLLAFYHEYKKNKMRDHIYWAAILVIFILFALGPSIEFFSTNTNLPTFYSLYRSIPLFSLVREPGRFDVVVTLAAAILAAVGFDHLTKSKAGSAGFAYLLAFSLIILVEYNGMPLSAGFANTLTTNATIPRVYSQLSGVPGNFSVLILPALPNVTTGSFLYPGISMYYQTAIHKPIVGGYTTRINNTQELLLENVPMVVSAAYLQSGQGFIFPYPVIENYSSLSLLWLTLYHTAFVVVNNHAYSQPALSTMLSYLYNVFGSPAYQDANATVFSASAAESLNGGRTLLSYIVGTWYPGYDFCTSLLTCNQTLATMWWGANVRAITIYAPNATNVRMNLQAISYYTSGLVQLYLNQNTQPSMTLPITNKVRNFSANFTLQRGFSQITLYQQNSSLFSQSPYLNFGIRNLTFTTTR